MTVRPGIHKKPGRLSQGTGFTMVLAGLFFRYFEDLIPRPHTFSLIAGVTGGVDQ